MDDTVEQERGLGPAAVQRLLENRERFLGFLQKRLGRRELAEDILQEAYARSLATENSLRQEDSATAWFYRLLRNAMTDHFRRRAVEERALAAAARETETVVPAFDEELMGAVCACVGALVETLKPEYAQAVRRVEVDGASVDSYAQELGITQNNASVRLHRAREALRRQLIRCCGGCAEHDCVDCSCSKPAQGARGPLTP